MARTRIVATLGPATSSGEAIGRLIQAGVDVFRLNFSHGTHAEHGARIALIRRLAGNRPVAILQDLAFGVAQAVDLVALSFVRRAADLEEPRASGIPVIAKFENAAALEHVEEIVRAADGIMVARGDLGVEIPIERVPMVQKELIASANRAGKPVITATQMLRSMVSSPLPTRAEATDVANAVLDGTDAVMLSEETAVGVYPVEAVTVMGRIMREAERAL